MTTSTADKHDVPEIRERIVAAARDLFAEHGLDGVSMRGVAERVGVTATALYHYFDNKDALVREVVESGFREFGRYLQDAAHRHPAGSLERVRAIGEAYVRFALDHQAYFRVLFSMQRPAPKGMAELPEGGGYELFRQAVKEAMESGAMRRAAPDLVVMYLWSLVHGLVTIALACRFDQDAECGPPNIPADPVDLLVAFGPFVRDGIRARGHEPSIDNGGK